MIPYFRNRIFGFTILGLFLGSCASSMEVVLEKLPINIKDNLAANRIEITYENTTNQDICLPYASFPLRGQSVNYGPGKILLSVDSVRYPLGDFDTGYCASDCSTSVPIGTSVFGFIKYSDFDLPEAEYFKSKNLVYEAYGYKC